MTVRRSETGTLVLEGICPVEDAEVLLQLLQAGPAAIDWTKCAQIHTAVLQVILASGITPEGSCEDAFVNRWLAPKLHSSDR